jgi:hypothetical protein
MISKVINISKGAINGGIVIVTSLTFDDNKMVTRVTNRANLMIRDSLTPSNFICIDQ